MLRLNQSEGWFTELVLRSWNWYFCLSHSSVLIRCCISMSELPIAKYIAVLGSIEVWSSGLRAYSYCKARQMACSHAHFCRQAQWISCPLKVSLILAQLSNLIGSGLFLGVYCHSNGIALHFRQILGSVFPKDWTPCSCFSQFLTNAAQNPWTLLSGFSNHHA